MGFILDVEVFYCYNKDRANCPHLPSLTSPCSGNVLPVDLGQQLTSVELNFYTMASVYFCFVLFFSPLTEFVPKLLIQHDQQMVLSCPHSQPE